MMEWNILKKNVKYFDKKFQNHICAMNIYVSQVTQRENKNTQLNFVFLFNDNKIKSEIYMIKYNE